MIGIATPPGHPLAFLTSPIEVVRIAARAPNMNATADRFVQSVRVDCLDHFVVFGEGHLRYLLKEYQPHYLEALPHQGLGNEPLGGLPSASDRPLSLSEVRCRERLGGLLKHYSRAVA
jgi:putative transposase